MRSLQPISLGIGVPGVKKVKNRRLRAGPPRKKSVSTSPCLEPSEENNRPDVLHEATLTGQTGQQCSENKTNYF